MLACSIHKFFLTQYLSIEILIEKIQPLKWIYKIEYRDLPKNFLHIWALSNYQAFDAKRIEGFSIDKISPKKNVFIETFVRVLEQVVLNMYDSKIKKFENDKHVEQLSDYQLC